LPIVSLAATRAGEAAPARAAWTRYAVTRFATIGDQVLVSLANFGLTLAIGRAYSAKELASYGIGLSLGLMVQGVQRHALIIPLMLLKTHCTWPAYNEVSKAGTRWRCMSVRCQELYPQHASFVKPSSTTI
jgi:hypothetical protein